MTSQRWLVLASVLFWFASQADTAQHSASSVAGAEPRLLLASAHSPSFGLARWKQRVRRLWHWCFDRDETAAPTCANGTITDRKALPETYWTATSMDGTCTDVAASGGMWRGHVLFTVPASAVFGAEGPVTYCSYEWQADATQPQGCAPDTGVIAELPDAAVDPPAVVPQQASDADITTSMREPLYALARARLGLPDNGERGPQLGRVRVAVIDTASGDHYGAYEDPSGHGRAVAKWIEEVACGDLGPDACSTHIVYVQALPLSGAAGARYGTRAMLATAIEDAVQGWLRDQQPGNPSRLVINLSVGWSAAWEDGGDVPVMPDFMRLALARAACHGASIVVAGGNIDAVDGQPEDAPLPYVDQDPHLRLTFPGLFATEQDGTITSDRCDALEIHTPYIGGDLPYAHYLIGVGAVDERDRRLANAANDMTLMAYGSAITVRDGAGWTDILSGTSMSAAAVSGMTAAALSASPELPSADVARVLLQHAPLLGSGLAGDGTNDWRDDYYGWSIRPFGEAPLEPAEWTSVRRASFCATMVEELHQSLPCVTPAVEPAASPVGADNTPAFMPLPPGGEPVASVEAFDCDLCPSAQRADDCSACTIEASDPDFAEQPWTGPQPPGKGCPACTLVVPPSGGAASFEAVAFDETIRPQMRDLIIEAKLSDGTTARALVSRLAPPQQLIATLPTTGRFRDAVGAVVKYHPPGPFNSRDPDAWYVQAIPIAVRPVLGVLSQ